MTTQSTSESTPSRPVLDALISRLYASMVRGPAINCYPGRSRQRVDFGYLSILSNTTGTTILNALMGSETNLKVELPLCDVPPLPANKNSIESPEIRQARRENRDRQALVSKLGRITNDALTYERDTGAWTLYLGYPLLSFPTNRLDPARRRRAQVLAPIGFISLTIKTHALPHPAVTLSCAERGSDRLMPNPALSAWLERQAGENFPYIDEDTEGKNPGRELRTLIDNVARLLRINDAQMNDWAVEVVPERKDLPTRPTIMPCGVIGLYPLTNQCSLRDMEQLRDIPKLPDTVAPFLSLDTSLTTTNELNDFSQAGHEDKSIDEFSAINEHYILPADPCQRKAIHTSRESRGLVIHGPPGTGKSQTIANLIGEHLARGERVLVVCEKRVALDVVKYRLDGLGLGNLCAVVHNATRDRSTLFKGVRRQIENLTETNLPPESNDDLNRVNGEIDRLRLELNSWYDALEEPDRATGLTFHDIAGRWFDLESTAGELEPALDFHHTLASISLPAVLEREGELRHTLERGLRADYSHNCWLGKIGISLNDLLKRKTTEVRHAMRACVDAAQNAAQMKVEDLPGYIQGIDPYEQGKRREWLSGELHRLYKDVDWAIMEACSAMAPHDAEAVNMESEHLAEAREIVASGSLARDLAMTNDSAPTPLVNITRTQANLDYYLKKCTGLFGFFHLVGRLKASKVLRRFNLSMSRENVERVRDFIEGISARHAIREYTLGALGNEWVGVLKTDRDLLSIYDQCSTVISLLYQVNEDPALRPLMENVRVALRQPKQARELTRKLIRSRNEGEALSQCLRALDSLALFSTEALKIFSDKVLDRDATLRKDMENLERDFPRLEALLRFEHEADENPAPLADALRELARRGISPDVGWRHLLRGLYYAALQNTLEDKSLLLTIDPERLASASERLRDLTIEKSALEAQAIQNLWLKRQRDGLLAATGSRLNTRGGELRRRLLLRGRNASRLRQAIHSGPDDPSDDPLFDIHPVWMAAPQTVSQIFPLRPLFDTVIFDEASQCRLEEGLPVLARGWRVVIAGDTHQLPPTRFFESGIIDRDRTDQNEGDDTSELFTLQQSEIEDLLSAALNIDIDQTFLDVHYRSRREELIEFSNEHFYNGRLEPVPKGPETNSEKRAPAVCLHRVDGLYEHRQNRTEADRVVALVREILLGEESFTDSPSSIGIATFNLPQKDMIIEALNEAAETDKQFADALDEALELERNGTFEGLFVKNLENVQGDERDIIIISTTFGPDSNGRFYRRFGPLTIRGGERRLNVLITRARQRVEIVTSIPADQYRSSQIVPQGARPTGSWYLMEYLKYAESLTINARRGGSITKDVVEETASPFIKALNSRLNAGRKVVLHHAHRRGAFSLDLTLGPNDSQSATIGVLCDTASRRHAGSAMEWDIFRESILRRAGWRLYRIWTPHFVRDPETALADLINETNRKDY